MALRQAHEAVDKIPRPTAMRDGGHARRSSAVQVESNHVNLSVASGWIIPIFG
jgi:hypothetical protein